MRVVQRVRSNDHTKLLMKPIIIKFYNRLEFLYKSSANISSNKFSTYVSFPSATGHHVVVNDGFWQKPRFSISTGINLQLVLNGCFHLSLRPFLSFLLHVYLQYYSVACLAAVLIDIHQFVSCTYHTASAYILQCSSTFLVPQTPPPNLQPFWYCGNPPQKSHIYFDQTEYAPTKVFIKLQMFRHASTPPCQ